MAPSAREARTYRLTIELRRPRRVSIGRLGVFDFPAGRYVYTGSARRGLQARVRRHLSSAKRLHWHIDYLLAAPGAKIVAVTLSDMPECVVNQGTAGNAIVKGFGASDCASGCGAHLKFVGPAQGERCTPRRVPRPSHSAGVGRFRFRTE